MLRALVALVALAVSGLATASTAYVTEFKERPPVTYQAAAVPALVNQAVTFTTASVQSAVFNYQTQLVRVHCDADCWVLFGTNPTATTSMMKIPAGGTEYFTIPATVPGGALRLAVIGL
jgi:hypothetical protein